MEREIHAFLYYSSCFKVPCIKAGYFNDPDSINSLLDVIIRNDESTTCVNFHVIY